MTFYAWLAVAVVVGAIAVVAVRKLRCQHRHARREFLLCYVCECGHIVPVIRKTASDRRVEQKLRAKLQGQRSKAKRARKTAGVSGASITPIEDVRRAAR